MCDMTIEAAQQHGYQVCQAYHCSQADVSPVVTTQHLVKVAHLAAELARASGGNTPLAPLLRALLPTLARAHPAVSSHAPAGGHSSLPHYVEEGVINNDVWCICQFVSPPFHTRRAGCLNTFSSSP